MKYKIQFRNAVYGTQVHFCSMFLDSKPNFSVGERLAMIHNNISYEFSILTITDPVYNIDSGYIEMYVYGEPIVL